MSEDFGKQSPVTEQRGVDPGTFGADGWHYEAFTEFYENSNKSVLYQDFFRRNRHRLNFNQVQAVLSVGPASGKIDIPLIKELLPNCRDYFAVEPDTRPAQNLKTNLANCCPDVNCHITSTIAKKYSGPTKPVDLVVVSHCLYYMDPAEVRDLVKSCKRWLRPGGHAVFAHHDGYLPGTAPLCDHLKNYPCFTNEYLPILRNGTEFGLKIVGDEDLLETFKYDKRTPPIANLLMGRCLNNQEVDMVYDTLEKTQPGGVAGYKVTMISLKKEQVGE